jgi:CBS domain-containing protein
VTRLVRDYMHPGVITCRADATLGQVAVMLTQHHVHALVVADRDGRPLGIISDFDLLAGEWLSADPESLEAMRTMTAGELMSTPVDTVEADTPFSEAARRMREEEVHRLLVLEAGNPVGVISISDFVAGLAATVPPRRETVADVMSDAMLTCRDKTPVIAAARAMTDSGYRSVVVVNARGKPLGVVSGLDLLAFCEQDECEDVTVADVMHPAISIHISASVREAADKMIKHHHHRLVVVDPDEPEAVPLGMISSFDIVAEMARPGSVWQQ